MTTLIIIIPIMVSVAFFTLIERNLIALSHFRIGPNKMGISGIFQPFNDAINLLTNENVNLENSNGVILSFAPITIMTIAMVIWAVSPVAANISAVSLNLILFIALSSISVFFFIISGWSSYSNYSLLGAYRSIAQTISYEITIIIIILPSIIIVSSLSTQNLSVYTTVAPSITILPLLIIWIVTILAEANRTPFDLSEGESELVSGYNTEYANGQFSIIFIAEYSIILLLSILTSIIFWSTSTSTKLLITTAITATFFIWSRVSFPRIRYDILISMAWNTFLPVVISIFTILIINMM